MSITIHDLAKLAEVNASTVSRALRGDVRVRKETAERIRNLAEQYGYTPNLPARQLAAGRTGNILLCIGTPDSEIERFSAFHLSELCDRAGYDLQIVLHYNDFQTFRHRLEKLFQHTADGAILIPPGDVGHCSELTDLVNTLPIPHVFVDRYWDGIRAPVVTTDNAAAARHLVERALAWGARRFRFFFDENNPVAASRLAAARARIQEAGLDESDGSSTQQHLPLAIIGNSGKSAPEPILPEKVPVFGGFFDYWENPTLEFYEKIIVCRQNFISITEAAMHRMLQLLNSTSAGRGISAPPAGDDGCDITRIPAADFIELTRSRS